MRNEYYDPCDRCDGEDMDCVKCKAKYERVIPKPEGNCTAPQPPEQGYCPECTFWESCGNGYKAESGTCDDWTKSPQPTDEEIENTLLEIEAVNIWDKLSDDTEEFISWYKAQSVKLKQQAEEIGFLGNALDSEVINRDNANRALADKEEEIEKLKAEKNELISKELYEATEEVTTLLCENQELKLLLSEAVESIQGLIDGVESPHAELCAVRDKLQQYTKDNE